MSDTKQPSETRQEQTEFAENAVNNLFSKMGVLCDLKKEDSGEEVWFSLNTDDNVFNFGDLSKNVSAVNIILKRIVENKFGDDSTRFLVDINNIQRKHLEEIRDAARMHAQRVRYFKKEIEMSPMNAYERRVVHTVLQEYPDIKTESAGEGFERRVVVKPVSLG